VRSWNKHGRPTGRPWHHGKAGPNGYGNPLAEAEQAAGKLQQTAPDELKAELAEVQQERGAAANQINGLVEQAEPLREGPMGLTNWQWHHNPPELRRPEPGDVAAKKAEAAADKATRLKEAEKTAS
jgi:hypothetical protein